MIASVLFGLFIAGLIYGALHDVATMTIPNWLSLAFMGLFPVAAYSAGLSWVEFGWHIAAGLTAFLICIGLFSIGIFGGGDAKMLPAVFLWLGPDAALPYIYGIALIGGALALVILVSRRLAPKVVVPGFLRRSFVEGPGIPYAVAISAGAVYAIPHSLILSAISFPILSAH